jgi:hypothetical protein
MYFIDYIKRMMMPGKNWPTAWLPGIRSEEKNVFSVMVIQVWMAKTGNEKIWSGKKRNSYVNVTLQLHSQLWECLTWLNLSVPWSTDESLNRKNIWQSLVTHVFSFSFKQCIWTKDSAIIQDSHLWCLLTKALHDLHPFTCVNMQWHKIAFPHSLQYSATESCTTFTCVNVQWHKIAFPHTFQYSATESCTIHFFLSLITNSIKFLN